jgi:nitrate reductase gamma subunit
MIQFNTLVPVYILDYIALIFVLVIATGVIYKFREWLRVVPAGFFHDARTYLGSRKLAALFSSELVNGVVAQKNVITDSRARWLTHFLVFWGFIGLVVATIWDDVFFNRGTLPPPFSLQNPGNIVGNIAGLMAFVGATVILGRYLFLQKFRNIGKGDTFFFATLYIAIVTGFATEFTRYLGASMPAYVSYLIHIAIVGALFISAPFTHFFHAVLTPFMRYVERIRMVIQSRKGDTYLGDRFLTMSKSSESVKSGVMTKTRPEWLTGDADEKETKKG